ncbi:ABC transporter substrate-binding protein [Candidatus Methanomassiliicoccus intestinalis]|uniref:ABC transporter substrate-binding protein n=1 Tax=Candidatus Methanomassiliicoccus intestinalis TaxID=1406512 RepID=UPI0037DC9912
MQVQKSIVAIIIVAVIIVAGVGVYFFTSASDDDETNTVNIDFAGQEIVPASDLDGGIVAVGQDSFRWMTYFGLADKCVMVDQNDMTNYLGKTFMYVGRAQVDIDGGDSAKLSDADAARKYFTHSNCAITTEDVKTIIELKPSIVVVPAKFYTDYRNEMAAIENSGINTIAIGEIYTFLDSKTFMITDDLEKQIDVLSKALGQEKRGNELKEAFKEIVNDLKSFSGKVTEKKSAYIGSVSYNGAHGINSSLSYYLPFELANVTNIIGGSVNYEGSGVKEYSAATIKNGIKEDTILFVDASGYSSNTDNTSQGIIKMFEGHDAYLIAPYIWTGINYESVFIDAYQILRYAYGDSVITESQMNEKINHVYDLFFGTHESNRNISEFKSYTVDLPDDGTSIFEDMNSMYLVAKKNPIFGEISIDSSGKMSY